MNEPRRDSMLERGVIGGPPPLVRDAPAFTVAEVQRLLAEKDKEASVGEHRNTSIPTLSMRYFESACAKWNSSNTQRAQYVSSRIVGCCIQRERESWRESSTDSIFVWIVLGDQLLSPSVLAVHVMIEHCVSNPVVQPRRL